MNYDEIITFLQIVEDGSIMQASEKLFISQAAASLRIKQLEEKLNTRLFDRRPGVKGTTLTKSGENLLPLAQNMRSLWNEILNVRTLDTYRDLKIGSLDSINLYYFEQFYQAFTSRYSHIYLKIFTYHSSRIHELIENQTYDIGFVFGLYEYPNVISKPLFTESMVVIVHNNNNFINTLNFNDLDVSEEVYVRWSTEFESWHNKNLNFTQRKKITVGTATMIPSFLNNEFSWAFAPKTMANKLCKLAPGFSYINLENTEIPKRTGYILYHKFANPEKKKILNLVLSEIESSIKQIETVIPMNHSPVK